jgi:Ran GTPase-activating protein (RanGAP) involved in mRNA processing and transport
LADVLKENNTITSVSIADVQIGDKGVKSLLGALQVNNTIKTVFLRNVVLSNEGAKILARVIRENKTLNNISIGECCSKSKLRIEGLKTIADAFCGNIGWRDLPNLHFNNVVINDTEARAILEYINVFERSFTKNEEDFQSEIDKKNLIIASLNNEVEKKKREISSLKAAIGASMEQLRMIVDPIDLTDDGSEPKAKRPRIESTAKSSLAIMHEHNQQLVQVKQEKTVISGSLRTVTEEKKQLRVTWKKQRRTWKMQTDGTTTAACHRYLAEAFR